MVHDFAITRNHVVWLDLPVVFDAGLIGRGLPFRWDDSYGARLGVMPRRGGDVRWFDVDPCYVFHVGNAREDERGGVVIEGVRYSDAAFAALWPRISGTPNPVVETGGAVLHRWVLDLATGAVREERLDDRAVEFPTINDRHTGLGNRYLYAMSDDAVVKYDTVTGCSVAHGTGAASPGEAVFVGSGGSEGEDHGWLLTLAGSDSGAELLVLDASDLKQVASVRLPRRVPAGFHGSWIPDE
jgi:carotenoid cleavage dioxygenase